MISARQKIHGASKKVENGELANSARQ